MLYDWPPVSFSTIMSMVGIGGIINYPLIDWEDTAYIFIIDDISVSGEYTHWLVTEGKFPMPNSTLIVHL